MGGTQVATNAAQHQSYNFQWQSNRRQIKRNKKKTEQIFWKADKSHSLCWLLDGWHIPEGIQMIAFKALSYGIHYVDVMLKCCLSVCDVVLV